MYLSLTRVRWNIYLNVLLNKVIQEEIWPFKVAVWVRGLFGWPSGFFVFYTHSAIFSLSWSCLNLLPKFDKHQLRAWEQIHTRLLIIKIISRDGQASEIRNYLVSTLHAVIGSRWGREQLQPDAAAGCWVRCCSRLYLHHILYRAEISTSRLYR